MSQHLVRPATAAEFTPPEGWASAAKSFRRWTVVGEEGGAVHTGFGICEMDPGGSLPAHVHSFEESVFVVDGSGVLDTSEGSFRLSAGDYGLIPVWVPHRWRNDGDATVRWAEMQGPVPRDRHGGDTFLVPSLPQADPIVPTRATRARGGSATSRATTWIRRGRARTCWRCRQACAPRSSSTAGSR